MASKEIFVPSSATTEIPKLGFGYDPVVGFEDNPLQSALSAFDTTVTDQESTLRSKISELTSELTIESDVAVSASFKNAIVAEFKGSSYSKLFEKHSLFVLQVFLVKRSSLL